MKLSRRGFLRTVLGIGLIAWSGSIFKRMFLPSEITQTEERTLTAYLDTLLPPYRGPSASELSVHKEILKTARVDRKYRRLIKKGCVWLDSKANKLGADGFGGLDEQGREEVLALAEGSRPGSAPQVFYLRTRADAFFHYYVHAETWKSVGYNGPPQPRGFPEYTEPPG